MGRGGGAQKYFLGADLADFRYNYVIICIFTGVVDDFVFIVVKFWTLPSASRESAIRSYFGVRPLLIVT